MNFPQIPLTFDMLPAAIAMGGALMVARYDRWSFIGWALWLISNLLWIGWALVVGDKDGNPVWGVLLQNLFFFGTSLQGMRKTRAAHVAAAAAAPTPAASGSPSAAAAAAAAVVVRG